MSGFSNTRWFTLKEQRVVKGETEQVVRVPDDVYQNFHITKVEVFTGDDNYQETEGFSIVPGENGKLKGTKFQHLEPKPKNTHRLRDEPAVRIFLESENLGSTRVIEIAHHKGEIKMGLKSDVDEFNPGLYALGFDIDQDLLWF